MKVVAYTALHYGRDYLGSAIRSVIDHIDEYWVLYSAVGSHGHRANVFCPETRDELYAIAEEAAGDKLRWYDGSWPYEGAQREYIHTVAPDADVILVLDADEIWSPGTVFWALETAKDPRYGDIHAWRVPMIHYWRSFHRCILHDPAYPVRVIKPKVHGDTRTLDLDGRDADVDAFVSYMYEPYKRVSRINHMGYAQRPEIVEYKLLTHGHRGEFRRDLDWFREKFMANAQEDCHPVGSEYWNTEHVNPLDYMPSWMVDHPYYKMEVIG